MRSALALAVGVAACAARLVAAQTPAGDQLLARGALSYVFYCAACHGGNAGGDPARHAPELAGQSASSLVPQLTAFRQAARSSGAHGKGDHARAFAELSAEDIEAIAEYLATLAPSPAAAH